MEASTTVKPGLGTRDSGFGIRGSPRPGACALGASVAIRSTMPHASNRAMTQGSYAQPSAPSDPDPRTSGPDPRTVGPDPRTVGPDPRTVGPDPRTVGPAPPTVPPPPRTGAPSPRRTATWPSSRPSLLCESPSSTPSWRRGR